MFVEKEFFVLKTDIWKENLREKKEITNFESLENLKSSKAPACLVI